MAYRIEISPAAVSQFRKLTKVIQRQLKPHIDALADNPRPSSVEKLRGATDQYRIRVGDYRIIYQIQDQALIILVLKIGHRRDIYRR
jgi:mRNA interferase RelE/StbE